jgi:hypothetical protein
MTVHFSLFVAQLVSLLFTKNVLLFNRISHGVVFLFIDPTAVYGSLRGRGRALGRVLSVSPLAAVSQLLNVGG